MKLEFNQEILDKAALAALAEGSDISGSDGIGKDSERINSLEQQVAALEQQVAALNDIIQAASIPFRDYYLSIHPD